MNSLNMTSKALTDQNLFNSNKHFHLKVIKSREGEKSLSLTRPSFFERVLAYFGFGPASLKEVNKFLNSNEGQSQINILLNSHLDAEKQLIRRNLEILHSKMEEKWGLGKIFTAAQSALPQPHLNSLPQAVLSQQGLLINQGLNEVENQKNSFILSELQAWIKSKSSSFTTNLVESHPSWLPKATITPIGSLSVQNFNHLIFNKLNSIEKEEILKWMFEQRKFPKISFIDQFIIPSNHIDIKNYKTAPEDLNGYARSISLFQPENAIFIKDEFIQQIEAVKTIRRLPYEGPFIGIYEDGRTIFLQEDVKGGPAACAAMLIEDHQKSCNIASLINTKIASTDIVRLLKEAGLNGKEMTIKGGIEELEKIIQKHGPLACTVAARFPLIGGRHEIILDKITNDQATIRDPFHGWRVTIPTSYFLQVVGSNPSIVYVQNFKD